MVLLRVTVSLVHTNTNVNTHSTSIERHGGRRLLLPAREIGVDGDLASLASGDERIHSGP